MSPEQLATIRAERNAALENLRIHQPILWCIIIQPRGEAAIAEALAWPIDTIREELTTLLHTKQIRRRSLKGNIYYDVQAKDRDNRRLWKRAQNIKYNNFKQLIEEKKK